MFLVNPIIALILNVPANRWHPVLFAESPLPGGGGPIRHKSKGHHTTGFATREEAEAYARNDLAPKVNDGTVRLELEAVFGWDGEGVPALVHFFPEPVAAAVR